MPDTFVDLYYIVGNKYGSLTSCTDYTDYIDYTDYSLLIILIIIYWGGWCSSQTISERFNSGVGRHEEQKLALVHGSGQLNEGMSIKQLRVSYDPTTSHKGTE